MSQFLFFLVFVGVIVGGVVGQDDNDAYRVEGLPGQPPVTFKQYAGYIDVDKQNGRNLFYWFAESQGNPETDPVLVWYQGGPGCSGLFGMFTENGPFLPNMANPSATDLMNNPFSWNRFANTLYIDSPAGVGFSYSNTPSDYTTDNSKTASDNYVFLQRWFKQYSKFDTNPLWLAGESYAGDYVPQLVELIVNGSDPMKERLEGFALGNPVMSCNSWIKTNRDIEVNMYYWHGMIPLYLQQKWLNSGCVGTSDSPSKQCDEFYGSILASVGPYDPDDLYHNNCTGNGTLNFYDGVTDGCSASIDVKRDNYLNRLDVQEQIHVHDPPREWVMCTTSKQLNYTSDWPDMTPYYEYFFSLPQRLKILIFSGDVDIATVPHAYTQLCIQEMDRPLLEPWRQWLIDEKTAGYVEKYDGFTYATLKGGGHEAAEFVPLAAYELIVRFIAGEL